MKETEREEGWTAPLLLGSGCDQVDLPAAPLPATLRPAALASAGSARGAEDIAFLCFSSSLFLVQMPLLNYRPYRVCSQCSPGGNEDPSFVF